MAAHASIVLTFVCRHTLMHLQDLGVTSCRALKWESSEEGSPSIERLWLKDPARLCMQAWNFASHRFPAGRDAG